MLFGILGAAAVATAIAVPLVLSKKGDQPVADPTFTVDTEAKMWDPIYTTLTLNWTPAKDEIEFSDFEFKYSTSSKTAEYIDIVESTTGSISLNLTFSDLIYENDISDGVLSFNYDDKTTGRTGQKTIEGINISKYTPPQQPIFETAPEGETLMVVGFNEELAEKPTNVIIPSYIFNDGTPTKVTRIEAGAFSGDSQIETLVISNTITNIGYSAFDTCSDLTKVTFADHSQITSLSNSLFNECYSLKSIKLPGSIVSMGDNVFNCNYELKSITFGGTIEKWKQITFGDNCWNQVPGEQDVHCTDGDTPLYP